MSDPGPTVFNGRYELHRRLGRGGMADVFLARDQLLDRPVAMKVLFPEFATDPAFVERFRREATAAANLNHPNIVGVYDWGEADGTYFIVMEYVDGRTLSEILRAEGPLHPDRVADVGADVAAALGFAHRNGVVHRDVKPGNVLVTAAGQVKVADFGIARAITANADENLTQVGTVMGTATYFSPEQARGDAVDPRSDIYSLGCVLYELLVGRPPFSGDTPGRHRVQARAGVAGPAPPDQPRAARRPSRRSSSSAWPRTRSNRYPSAEDLRADLRRFREGSGILAEPVMVPLVDPGATSVVAATTAVAAADGEPPYYDEDETTSRSGRRGWFLVGLIMLLVLLAGMLYLLAQQFTGEDDRRHAGRGARTWSASRSTRPRTSSASEGFEVEITQEANEDEAEGNVFDQDPKFGAEGRRGLHRAAQGQRRRRRPSRCPTSSAPRSTQARQRLTADGFTVKEEQVVDEEAPVGEVVDQDPGPERGGAPRLRGHDLRVEAARADRPVPDVVGKTIAEASNLLGQAGFAVEPDVRALDTVEEGRVIRTDPPADTGAAEGRRRHRGRVERPGGERRPDVVGLIGGQRHQHHRAATGFRAVVEEVATDDPAQDGRVVDQDPTATPPPRTARR